MTATHPAEEPFEPASTDMFQRFAESVESELAALNFFQKGHVYTRYVEAVRDKVRIARDVRKHAR